jgi:hypothetical protein
MPRATRQPQAREQPGEVGDRRRQSGLVKIVEVEVDEPIVSEVAAEVLEMKVPASPHGWTLRQRPARCAQSSQYE